MEIPAVDDWPRSEDEAFAVQDALRGQVIVRNDAPVPGEPGTLVAGVDVASNDERDLVAAAAVVLDAATLTVDDRAVARGHVAFLYVPGLLAFRELPAVMDALRGLCRAPDLVVCDGYGLAHPRRFGLAGHLGVLTGLPASPSRRSSSRTVRWGRGAVTPRRCSTVTRRSGAPCALGGASSRSSSPSATG